MYISVTDIKMSSRFFNMLSGMTDKDTATILIIVLPERTVQIANALLEKGIVTGYFRDYAFFDIQPHEFAKVMEKINERQKLI